MIIDKYKPPIDLLINGVKELIENNCLAIKTSLQPEFVGLAVDLDYVMSRLHPYFRTEFTVRTKSNRVKTFGIHEKSKYTIKIDLDESLEFDTSINGDYSDKSIIYNGTLTGDYIKFYMSDSTEKSERDARSSIIIGEGLYRYLHAGKRLDIIAYYGNLRNYRISLGYNNFEPQKSITLKNSHTLNYYPVSEKSEQVLESKYWNYICEPLKWYAKSNWIENELFVLSGIREPEEIAKNHSRHDYRFVKEMLEREHTTCFTLIENDVFHDAGDTADVLGCPPELRGMFLNNILTSLKKIANPSTLNEDSVKTLVNLYNAEYSTNNYHSKITKEDLCLKPKSRRNVYCEACHSHG
jgi:hypothetical protein